MNELIKVFIVISFIGLISTIWSGVLFKSLQIERDKILFSFRLIGFWVLLVGFLVILPKSFISLFFVCLLLVLSRKFFLKYRETAVIFLLLMLPTLELRVPGALGIDSLFVISLPLFILLAFWEKNKTINQPVNVLKTLWGLLFVFFISMYLVTQFISVSLTEGLRWIFYYGSMFYLLFSYAKTRSEHWLQNIVLGFLLVGLVTSLFGIFETLRTWLLFTPIIDSYIPNAFSKISAYKFREGSLRSFVVNGNLQTALIISCSIIIMLGMRRNFKSKIVFLFSISILLYGLLSTGSRGALLVLLFLSMGIFLFEQRIEILKKIVLYIFPIYLVLDYLGAPNYILQLAGLGSDFNYQYRLRLYDESMKIILDNLLFPAADYSRQLAAAGLIQGEGIVDIVNTYLQIGLYYGGLAFICFLGFVYFASYRLVGLINQLPHSSARLYSFIYFFVFVNFLIQIASVSSVGFNSIFFIFLYLAICALMSERVK